MERTWWWKAIGVLLLVLMAVAFLLPTFISDKLPDWYTKYVDAEIKLGLDLQGGIHLVYEVEVDKAVADKADRMASTIVLPSSSLLTKPIAPARSTRGE